MMEHKMQNALAEIAALLRANPEITEDETLLADMIEGSTSVPETIDALLESAAGDEAMRDARKARAKELSEKASADDARRDRKRALIAKLMEAAGVKKMTVTAGTVSLIAGKPSIKIDSLESLPQGYYTLVETRVADKQAIKSAVESGEEIPGVSVEQKSPHIQVR